MSISSRLALPLWSLFLSCLHASCVAGDCPSMGRRMVWLDGRQESSPLAISSQWQVLGPFQIGTREGSWGADPLECLGGFRQLRYDPDARFRSSLPSNGTATWSLVEAKHATSSSTSANVSLSIGYDNVDWDFLKTVYGWAAVQYQAWARGDIVVRGNDTQHVVLYTDAIAEYWVDRVHYFGGDFYSFRKAPPVLHLAPGRHQIDLRLWRDVRAFGGINEPTIDVLVGVEKVSGSLELSRPGVLLADVVHGKLASPLASVSVRNSGESDLVIVGVQSSEVRYSFISTLPLSQAALSRCRRRLTGFQHNSTFYNFSETILVAGQTRPLSFNISLPHVNVSSLELNIIYKPNNGDGKLQTLSVSQPLSPKSLFSPHKITYLHPGGMVSYAMLRPPAQNAACSPGRTRLPVVIANHGAGLEADSPLVAHALDPVSDLCAWVLFPTGVTPWSGDDWHNWGFADVEAAVTSIPSWMTNVAWQGPGVDTNRWVMTGHSNGGQGTWYALTHRPDKLVSAAPLSGYASIQKYVPYELWQPADPRRTSVISASLNSYRHEMLMENAKGIPVFQQHGELDDNVPAYNSRLLSQQLIQAGTNSSYHEFPGQSHWWDTVMTTEPLKGFYRQQVASNESIPRRLKEFSLVVGDPGDTGPKGGIRVLNLEDPGQYGRLTVKGHMITTSNVLRLELDPTVMGFDRVTVDGHDVVFDQLNHVQIRRSQDSWQTLEGKDDGSYRNGRQLGSITSILRTHGPFIIRHQGKQTAHVALQVSQNLHQYFYADCNVVSGNASLSSVDDGCTGNVISVSIGNTWPSLRSNFPILVDEGGVSVRDHAGRTRKYEGAQLGAAFLRPLDGERLELVIWGADEEGILQASRLVPTVTGVGQPDFVVLGELSRWKGVEGALALGFFDHDWSVTPSSVVS
ncbi:uncharacterized protein EI97DRAFT_486935 [Westerdykella ornata]|uniref:Peptidase S9 prolyl oligopeptidase catalytic domain-containing protein n=1 Tax=Westerdykella ornata TaxID=318751 RepID=A0A6A6J537_WESOR|nr:uncharacterized protein EI97DRAFT_486935 [Westerdykella ornata]KAF2271700.1 hypothetical protein EI97DRAFT_486935 [Westerdykella ornata]